MLLSHRYSLLDATKCSYYYNTIGILYSFCYNCTLGLYGWYNHNINYLTKLIRRDLWNKREIRSYLFFLVFNNQTENNGDTKKTRYLTNFVSFDYVIIMFNVSCHHQTTEAHETYCILLYTPERMEACTLLQTITSEKFLLFIFSVLFVKTFRCFVSLCIHTQYFYSACWTAFIGANSSKK